MIHISVEVTLLLGIGELQDAKLPEQRILKYQEMIRDSVPQAIDDIGTEIFEDRDSIDKLRFLSAF